MNDFNEALKNAKSLYPNIKIKYKDESFFMKFLSILLFFNKDFNTKYITTIGNSIYFPSKEYVNKNDSSCVDILCHELVHIQQSQDDKYFKLKYLFPQILALGAFLAFIHPIFFIFLLFALPIHAKFRAEYEYNAYVVTMYCKFNRNNNLDVKALIDGIINNFTKSSYYWMDRDYAKLYSGFYLEMAMIKANKNDLFNMKEKIDFVLGEN